MDRQGLTTSAQQTTEAQLPPQVSEAQQAHEARLQHAHEAIEYLDYQDGIADRVSSWINQVGEDTDKSANRTNPHAQASRAANGATVDQTKYGRANIHTIANFRTRYSKPIPIGEVNAEATDGRTEGFIVLFEEEGLVAVAPPKRVLKGKMPRGKNGGYANATGVTFRGTGVISKVGVRVYTGDPAGDESSFIEIEAPPHATLLTPQQRDQIAQLHRAQTSVEFERATAVVERTILGANAFRGNTAEPGGDRRVFLQDARQTEKLSEIESALDILDEYYDNHNPQLDIENGEEAQEVATKRARVRNALRRLHSRRNQSEQTDENTEGEPEDEGNTAGEPVEPNEPARRRRGRRSGENRAPGDELGTDDESLIALNRAIDDEENDPNAIASATAPARRTRRGTAGKAFKVGKTAWKIGKKAYQVRKRLASVTTPTSSGIPTPPIDPNLLDPSDEEAAENEQETGNESVVVPEPVEPPELFGWPVSGRAAVPDMIMPPLVEPPTTTRRGWTTILPKDSERPGWSLPPVDPVTGTPRRPLTRADFPDEYPDSPPTR